jgi:hypothetical protein
MEVVVSLLFVTTVWLIGVGNRAIDDIARHDADADR